MQGSKSCQLHARMQDDNLETRLNMRKQRSAKQISGFRMFMELRSFAEAQQFVASYLYYYAAICEASQKRSRSQLRSIYTSVCL